MLWTHSDEALATSSDPPGRLCFKNGPPKRAMLRCQPQRRARRTWAALLMLRSEPQAFQNAIKLSLAQQSGEKVD